MIVAEGDVKLNGNTESGEDNLQGTIYAGAQCELSGNLKVHGQVICADDPNPSGSENWVDLNTLNGNLDITYDCDPDLSASGSTSLRAIGDRAWTRLWN